MTAYKNVEDGQSNRSDNKAIFKVFYAVLITPKTRKCCPHLRQRRLQMETEHEQITRTESQVYREV